MGGLHMFARVLAVLLNNTQLLKVLFSEDYLLRLMGVLEYDPQLPSKQNHREFLQEKVKFKEVCGARK